jgi:hypothetical protein
VQAIELNQNNKKLRNHISKQMHDLIKGVMNLNTRFKTIACLFGKAFCEPYSKDFEEAKLPRRGSCPDNNDAPNIIDPCGSLTVLSSLLRVNIKLSLKTQSLLNEFFMFMFVDYQFKHHLAVEFVRMVNY